MTEKEIDGAPTVTVDVDRWRLDHKVPLVLIFSILVQTIYFTIWLRDLAGEVKQGNARLQEIWADRYTKADAEKYDLLLRARLQLHEQRYDDIERRFNEHINTLHRKP